MAGRTVRRELGGRPAPPEPRQHGMLRIPSGSIMYCSTTEQQPVFHEILFAIFLSLTRPISLTLIVRAALARDRMQGSPDIPQLASEADSSSG